MRVVSYRNYSQKNTKFNIRKLRDCLKNLITAPSSYLILNFFEALVKPTF
jgi:hypothetical protein